MVPIHGEMVLSGTGVGGSRTTLLVRVDAGVHRRAKEAAAREGLSLARYVERALRGRLGDVPAGRVVAEALLGRDRTARSARAPAAIEP